MRLFEDCSNLVSGDAWIVVIPLAVLGDDLQNFFVGVACELEEADEPQSFVMGGIGMIEDISDLGSLGLGRDLIEVWRSEEMCAIRLA